jgi:subtilase family serine protease
MIRRRIQNRIAYIAVTFAAAAPLCLLHAQRLPYRIDSRSKTVLRGSRNPHIDGLASEGPVDDTMRIHGMTFRFHPAPAQSAELESLLQEQQDPSSPRYHDWLTPQQYGERFGLNSSDMTKVAEWIASQGFQIDFTANSRTHISFSGTAAQVREAFGTELHRYRENGKTHFANTREIMIPAQLEPLVSRLSGLDDFPVENSPRLEPQVAYQDGSHAITPGDLAVIYNITPLFKKGINGAGQRIAVAGRTAFNMQDVRDFRNFAGLPPSDPKIVLYPGSKDPGYTDDIGEALLDLEYAGAAAPGATIIYVYGTDIGLAVQYAIDQNLAPILSFSYAACERRSQDFGAWYRNVAQQAAAQGITWVACTGDTGAAGCELQYKDSVGISGVSAKLPATVPEVTGGRRDDIRRRRGQVLVLDHARRRHVGAVLHSRGRLE